jgi:large subunit ribosomal protein L17
MRHRSKGRKLGRRSAPRAALRRDVVNALFRYGRITTTVPRAKEFRPWAERLVTIAKRGAAAKAAGDAVTASNVHKRLIQELHYEDSATKLVAEIAPKFADRCGGYTRIVRIAKVRKGDAAATAVFELVTYEPPVPDAAAADAAAKNKAKKSGQETPAGQ